MSRRVPLKTIASSSSSSSENLMCIDDAISSSGILRSMQFIIFTFPADLFATLRTRMSSGRMMSFSSQYCFIWSMKGWPNLRALPCPTPCIFCSSSIVVGYMVAICSSDASMNTMYGCTPLFRASLRRSSFSMEYSCSSSAHPVVTLSVESSVNVLSSVA